MSELVKQSNQRKLATITVDDNLTASPFKTGMIIPTAAPTADDGFLLCNGQAVSRTTYATLFARIGTAYGVGDNSTTFNVPDLRGVSPVGAGTSGLNANWIGPNLGATQNDQTQDHIHMTSMVFNVAAGNASNVTQVDNGDGGYRRALSHFNNYYDGVSQYANSMSTDGVNGNPRTGKYTRGPGVGVNFQIKT